MSSPSLVKLSPRTPENRSVKVPHPTIGRRKRAKSSAVDYSISLKFCTEFKYMTPKV